MADSKDGPPKPPEWAKRVHEELAKRNFGVPTLARRAGLTPVTLYRWLRGETEPRASDSLRLAEQLGLTMDELFR